MDIKLLSDLEHFTAVLRGAGSEINGNVSREIDER